MRVSKPQRAAFTAAREAVVSDQTLRSTSEYKYDATNGFQNETAHLPSQSYFFNQQASATVAQTLRYQQFVAKCATQHNPLGISGASREEYNQLLSRVITVESQFRTLQTNVAGIVDIEDSCQTGRQMLYSLNQTYMRLDDLLLEAKAFIASNEPRPREPASQAAEIATLNARLRLLEEQHQTDASAIRLLQAQMQKLFSQQSGLSSVPRAPKQAQPNFRSYGDVFFSLEEEDADQ